ncbi:hypothetical protein B0A48_00169 [Cryoendolithus antarcticus]|uniref:Uncharacterized protein n=1 Tax=Cryoendolithus antarcticus TaxID=1507870 RepID=A0A1V8TTY1_9PEZI|nr:hypothetical protein B0A48_00169 [Cryoendolithus antarcticus]
MAGSPLGTIPPEIRVMIFDDVLSEVIVDVGLNSRNPPGQTAYSQRARFSAITRVSANAPGAADIDSIRVGAKRGKNPSLAMAYAMMMADKLASIVKWSLGVDSHVLIRFGKDNKSRSIPLKIRQSPLLVSIERKATFATFERSINMEFKAMRAARAALDFNEHKQAGERQRLRDVLECVRHLFHSGDVVSSPVIGRSVMGLEAAKCPDAPLLADISYALEKIEFFDCSISDMSTQHTSGIDTSITAAIAELKDLKLAGKISPTCFYSSLFRQYHRRALAKAFCALLNFGNAGGFN